MIYIVLLILFIYITLIIALIKGFDRMAVFENKNNSPKNSFSIAIPFRDEAHNFPELLNSLARIDYPKDLFEIILVNDASQDDFEQIISQFTTQNPGINLTLIDNSRRTKSPKKDALTIAIDLSKFDWIVTTDADCKVPANWLLLFNQYIEEKKVLFISAPVKFMEEKSLLFHFQNLHFLSLIGSTIGGFALKKPFLCNGANLCYHKETFLELNGFKGNTNIASGDDIFLLEKMQQSYPHKTGFLKSIDALVTTKAQTSWKQFLNQQIRWTSKSTAYKNQFSRLVSLIVFSMNLLLVILGIISLLFPPFWILFLWCLALKSTVDLILIFKTSYFLNITNSLKYFLVISVLYPFFVVLIGGLSLVKRYTWKGQIFKN